MGDGRPWPQQETTSRASRPNPLSPPTLTSPCLASATAPGNLPSSPPPQPPPPRCSRQRATESLLSNALLPPLLLLLLPMLVGGTHALFPGPTLSKFDKEHIPWYNTSTKPFDYEGDHFVNSLPDLLGVQHSKNWVTVFVYNRAVQRWALNCIYSFIKFGKDRHYIVAATDETSLQLCIQRRLPCYNASFVLGAQGASLSDTQLNFNTSDYITINWGKVMVVKQILDLQYNVHFSDVDVVYMRPVWLSYRQLFLRAEPDAIFMEEETLINVGVYAMRSNNATRQLVDSWLSLRHNEGGLSEQAMFAELANGGYVVCAEREKCVEARVAGKPAVLRHPPQFGSRGVCPHTKWDNPCDPIRLYVHVICRYGWGTHENAKGSVMERFRLWLLDEDFQPLYNEDDEAWRHPFLPCQGPAWENPWTGR